MISDKAQPSASFAAGSLRVKRILVLTTAMLTFIPFWKAGAVVLCDFGSSAFYAGGIAFQAFGPAFPWYVLAVMLFSGAMLAIYVESCAMFVRGGVYKVVKEGLGGTMAKISVSAIMFDYCLTGPISGVSAGHYLAGLLNSLFPLAGMNWTVSPPLFAVLFAAAVTVFFWRQNIRGIEESSDTSAHIVAYTTVVSLVLLGWSVFALTKIQFTLPSFGLAFTDEALGWAKGWGWLRPIGAAGMLMAFGHSVLALSGLETMAQVYREMESPKMENLKKTAIFVFLYALVFTGLLTLLCALIIPSGMVAKYADNMLSGLAMSLPGPLWARLLMQTLMVVAGVVMLSGAVNTSLVGANGVLNRVAEDGVLTGWYRHLHPKYGTTSRIINIIALTQLAIILLCRGDVYLLGEAYAFGVMWSFVFKTAALFVLRFQDASKREWRVPFNLSVGEREIPAGVGLIFFALLLVSSMNLVTKKVATLSGLLFTAVFYAIFYYSEKRNEKIEGFEHGAAETHEERINIRQALSIEQALTEVSKPKRILVAVRNPENMHHFHKILESADADDTDILVLTSKVAKGLQFGAEAAAPGPEETELFTRVILTAEKYGQSVIPLFVLSNDPFYAIAQVAYAAKADQIVMGVSGAHGADSQLERLVMAWGAVKGDAASEKPVLARVIWEGRELSFELG
ncbi:MAG: amino acid permease [Elusimicrobiales bacterium]|nr:amino acid permease [Elusimicrobiales bacterium]